MTKFGVAKSCWKSFSDDGVWRIPASMLDFFFCQGSIQPHISNDDYFDDDDVDQ